MMGRKHREQASLFYEFRLDDMIPNRIRHFTGASVSLLGAIAPVLGITGRVHLPPASPELNPTENIWQYMRQSYLSNRVFRNYDDVVEASSAAWNKLVAEPGRIASIGTRCWTTISQGP
jgi:transposase